MADNDVQGIIRIAQTDVDGTKRIADALQDVTGVGDTYANAIAKQMPFDPETKIGALDDDEIEELEDVMANPAEYDIPAWLRNRRKDRETGDDKHLIESDLIMTQEFDVRRLKEIGTYRGRRHELGLPVRGQKTQSSFRSGEKIGVQRERIQEEAEPDEGDE